MKSKESSPNTASSWSSRSCLVSQIVSSQPVTDSDGREAVDLVALLDVVLVLLPEQAADEAQAIVRRRATRSSWLVIR